MRVGARVLVTGIGGFVGSHLAKRLAERGMVVLGVGIEPPPSETGRFLNANWTADILDRAPLERAIGEASPDAVVHLAAQSSGELSFRQPVETFRVNVLGTFTLLESVRTAAPGARVLVVGTGEVYGPQPAGSRAGEDLPLCPVSPYALSKAVADAAAESFTRRGLDVVRARSFGHCGPGQSDRFVIPTLARQIAEVEGGRRAPVLRVGNLEVTRDLTDVRDVAEAYVALLERGRAGAAYNVCRGEAVRLADVARWLARRARVSVRVEVDAARVRPADIPHLVGDPSVIEREVGWKAAISLDRTLEEVLDEWRGRRAGGEAPGDRV